MVKVSFVLSRACCRTDSVPPDNPRPVRFRWRSMTRAHATDHVGRSEQWLGALPSSDGIGGPRPSPPARQPSVSAAAPAHVWSLDTSDWRIGSDPRQVISTIVSDSKQAAQAWPPGRIDRAAPGRGSSPHAPAGRAAIRRRAPPWPGSRHRGRWWWCPEQCKPLMIIRGLRFARGPVLC